MNLEQNPMADLDSKPNVNVLWLALIVEGGLFCVAILLGWFGFCDHRQPLFRVDWVLWRNAIFWGVIATLPMLVYLAVFHFWTPAFFKPMRQFVDSKLKPMFRESTLLELLVLSVMAGLGEELFFRWCLQGGITSILEPRIGMTAAVIAGLVAASFVFGGCHWVNASYGITTILVGCYLGLAMIWTETWWVPAIAHALFDFVALIYIARTPAQPDRR